jgi:hypothetical protein
MNYAAPAERVVLDAGVGARERRAREQGYVWEEGSRPGDGLARFEVKE